MNDIQWYHVDCLCFKVFALNLILPFRVHPLSPSHSGLATYDINKTLLILLINYDVACSYN